MYCRFSSACASVALACSTRASADAARASLAATCSGPVCARSQRRLRLLLAGRVPAQPALGDADAGLGFGDLRPRRIGGRALRVGGRDRRVELLLRDFVLREQSAQPLDVARRSASRWPRPRAARACAVVSRALRGFDLLLGGLDAAVRLLDRALRRARRCSSAAVDVIGTLLCAAMADGFGVGQLGARLVDGDLIVARIDLDEHGAGFDLLVVVDRHAAAPCRRRAPRSASRAHPPAHRRSIRVPGVSHNQTPTRPATSDDHADDDAESAGAAMNGRCSIDRPSANASEKLTSGVFGDAEAAGEQRLGDVVAVERRDVLLVGERDRLLRLDDLDVAGDAGGEPIARLRSCCAARSRRARRDLQLFAAWPADRGTPCGRRSRSPPSGLRPRRARLRRSASASSSRPLRASALEDRHVDARRRGRRCRASRRASGRCRRSRR